MLFYVHEDQSSSASKTTEGPVDPVQDQERQSSATFINFSSVNGAVFDDYALPLCSASSVKPYARILRCGAWMP